MIAAARAFSHSKYVMSMLNLACRKLVGWCVLFFCVAEQGFHLTVLAVEGVRICGCDGGDLKPKNLWLIQNQG